MNNSSGPNQVKNKYWKIFNTRTASVNDYPLYNGFFVVFWLGLAGGKCHKLCC